MDLCVCACMLYENNVLSRTECINLYVYIDVLCRYILKEIKFAFDPFEGNCFTPKIPLGNFGL